MNEFDLFTDRTGTKSSKFDLTGKEGVLPMWVADMDFKTLPEVREALKQTAEHGIFGYSYPDEAYKKAVLDWVEDSYGYRPDEEDLVLTPGVVFAIAHAVRAFSKPGDVVLIQEPVYYPFKMVAQANGRHVVSSDLVEEDGEYFIDFDDLDEKMKQAKLMILSNPHNPVGKVFSKEELEKILELARKNDVLIIADEIHADFIYNTDFVSLGKLAPEEVILCTAPSKTFNLAGLQISNIFISDKKKREEFQKELRRSGAGGINIMALNACQAAYTYGKNWVKTLNNYIEQNFKLVLERLEKIPGVKAKMPQGTYLMWLDCRELGIPAEELNDFFLKEAGLWLDHGLMFGESGGGFMRLNAATQRSTINEAMDRLQSAVEGVNNEN